METISGLPPYELEATANPQIAAIDPILEKL